MMQSQNVNESRFQTQKSALKGYMNEKQDLTAIVALSVLRHMCRGKRSTVVNTLTKMRVKMWFSSVAQSCPILRPHGLQHTRIPCPLQTPGACSNSCPLSGWYHTTISTSVVSFSSHLQSFPASRSFPMSQFFTSGGQSIGVSTSASVLPMNIHDSFPLGLMGWISLLSEGLSRVFSNTTVQKQHFFSAQLSL